MKLTRLLSVFTATAATMTLVNCASQPKRDQAKQAPPPPTPAQQAVGNLENDRTQFVNQTQARIDEMTRFTSQLRAKAAQVPRVQGKKISNAADDLDSLLNDTRRELTDVRTSAPQNWVDNRRDVEKNLSRAESAYSNDISLLR